MVETEAPGAALLNQLLFIRLRYQRTSHVVMTGDQTGDVMWCHVCCIYGMQVSYDTTSEYAMEKA